MQKLKLGMETTFGRGLLGNFVIGDLAYGEQEFRQLMGGLWFKLDCLEFGVLCGWSHVDASMLRIKRI